MKEAGLVEINKIYPASLIHQRISRMQIHVQYPVSNENGCLVNDARHLTLTVFLVGQAQGG